MSLLPGVICRELWKLRGRHIHNGGNGNPHEVIAAVLRQMRTNAEAFPFSYMCPDDDSLISLGLVYTLQAYSRKGLRVVVWTFPTAAYTFKNDGFSLGNPELSGGGIIIRDKYGTIVVAMAIHLGRCTSTYAED